MKKKSKLYSGIAIMTMALTISTAPFFATNTQAMDNTKKTTSSTQDNEIVNMKGGYSILGSKFIGMEVQNAKGDNVGEVEDIVLDSKGKVRYAAVSYGGFMGMGDEMYAVPLDAFTFKRDKDMFFDDVVLVLNVSEEQLKDEKGFDKDNWPDLNDETYRKGLDTRYNVNSYGAAAQPAVKN